ncbi:MAG: PDZ domain-containing protein [Acidobacteria bacterium]|nr:PDZ domain-containing protein [Acidobacteriota bacterium]
MRRTAIVILIGSLISPAAAQTISLPKVSDDFKINQGSSFSATSSAQKSKPKKLEPLDALRQDLAEALDVIGQNHASADANRPDRLTASALRSALRSLDPHSKYYDREEFAELMNEHKGQYYGTGATIISVRDGSEFETYVLSVAAGSSADGAGIRFGDKITSVDSKDVGGLSSYEVREMMRGKLGTVLTLRLERAADGSAADVKLTRGRVAHKTLPHTFMLDDGVGYIDHSGGFSYTTVTELDDALLRLRARGLRSLVLDLRGNSGGIVDQAVAVAERFLPYGTKILTQQGRNPNEDRIWRSTNRLPVTVPLVVLVDGDTASAAEIVAGALQDNDRALIVGEKTFGKGLVQNIIELEDGSALALTAARYYTPTGRSIQRDYSDVGLYEYFRGIRKAELTDRPAYAVRTITDRILHGGDGISPDVSASQTANTNYAVSDALFLLTRDLANGRLDGQPSPEELRQSLIFGREILSADELRTVLANVISSTEKAEITPAVLDEFRWYLAMALFGVDSAAKARIESDMAVAAAIRSLPDAERLYARAAELRSNSARKEKSPQGRIPGGLR